MDDSPRPGVHLTRAMMSSALKELPSACARLSDGMIIVGSSEHITILRIIDTLESMHRRGVLSKKESAALLGVISGMTAPQSRAAHGGRSNASVHKLRERSVEKVREELNEQ